MMVCDNGISVPMPKPWMARPTMSIAKDCAKPATIEPTMKTARPPM